MAQFIAILRRDYDRFSEADFTRELLDAEAEQARVLHGRGVFRQMWGHSNPAGAVILLEADSREAAERELYTLPLHQKRMLAIEVLSVGPYRGFGPRG